jgi:transcriptional regulator
MREPGDFLHGTLDVLVLKTLSWQAMHGYAIARWIEERSTGAFSLEDAALYKALHRLEAGGAIGAEWGLSENNRRARYYALTAKGRRQLHDEAESWRAYAKAVARVLDTAAVSV